MKPLKKVFDRNRLCSLNCTASPSPSRRLPCRRYVQRKVRDEFHKNVGLSGEELVAALTSAKANQTVIQRQVEVYRWTPTPCG